jgi:Mn-dependent DtxR family transcriptional regulator
MNLLAGLHAQGRTILMVTHDEQVGRRADRRLHLEHGRIHLAREISAEKNQDFDEVLEQLWMARERHQVLAGDVHIESTHFTTAQYRRLTAEMDQLGLVTVTGWEVTFTQAGEERARSVIRRHRLAERLFTDVLALSDEQSVETNACQFEHILSPELTDRICTFLGHPTTCPHGSLIPPGPCCARGESQPDPPLLEEVVASLRGI